MRKAAITIPTRGFPAYAFVPESVVVLFWVLCIVFTIVLHICWKKGYVNVR